MEPQPLLTDDRLTRISQTASHVTVFKMANINPCVIYIVCVHLFLCGSVCACAGCCRLARAITEAGRSASDIDRPYPWAQLIRPACQCCFKHTDVTHLIRRFVTDNPQINLSGTVCLVVTIIPMAYSLTPLLAWTGP